MIQTYTQTGTYQPMQGNKVYYVHAGTYLGISYDTKLSGQGAHVTLEGTSTEKPDGTTVVNLTWPLDQETYGERIKIEVTAASKKKSVYFGIYYEKDGIREDQYFLEGETSHAFVIPKTSEEVRFAAFVDGGIKAKTTFDVTIFYLREGTGEAEMLSRNGDMTLFPTEATVHAVLNGSWEAMIEHPLDSEERWKQITEETVVKMPSFNGEQLFRIKQTEKADSGITACLEPIFYDAMDDCFLEDIRPTRVSAQTALNQMLAPNPKYRGTSNITRVTTAYYQMKNFLEALNGDDENSFVNRWGGEILFDNYHVIVDERIGGDYGVELRYGKNICQDGLTEEIDIREVVTRIYPKAYNGYERSGVKYVDSPLIHAYPIVKTAVMTFEDVKMKADASEEDEENGIVICKDQEELNEALAQKCQEQFEAGLDKPKVTITADMILLQNTEEYQEYQMLETVSLGDTVHCRHSRLGIITDARVIEIKYDSIRKKTISVVLGDFTAQYFDKVSSSVNRIDHAIRPNGSVVAEQIEGIINAMKASLRFQNTVAQKQEVRAVLFEDLDPESELYGALSIGTKGLEIADQRTADGRDWEWTTALTAKGGYADVFKFGTILATLIHGGTLTLGGIDDEAGILEILDEEGKETIGKWSSNGIVAERGTIGGFTTTANGLTSNLRNSEGTVMKQVQILNAGYDSETAIVVKKRRARGEPLKEVLKITYDGEILMPDGEKGYLKISERNLNWYNSNGKEIAKIVPGEGGPFSPFVIKAEDMILDTSDLTVRTGGSDGYGAYTGTVNGARFYNGICCGEG
nr:MAG TPA: tail protein [Caudoviricetes sp.]